MGRTDGKTEKATPERRREARSEGTVARSQEVGTAVALLGAALTLRVAGPTLVGTATTETRGLLAAASGDLAQVDLVGPALRMLGALAGPFLGISVLLAIVAGTAQVGLKVTPKAAKPKLSHLSPKKGLEKFKPAAAGWELTRTAIKIGMLAVVVWGPVSAWMGTLGRPRTADAALADLFGQVWTVLVRCVLLAVVVAAADYAWNRWRTEKQLRMSKEDIKQEHKNREGDPHVKGQRRRRQQELSRNRMLADVATADVVVVNPTHIAVALRYRDGDPAPRVVARGADHVAARIRREAHRHGIPVTEDVPTARALYRQCKVGQVVPSALFEAVAIVLAIAWRRSGRVPVGSTRAGAA